MSQPVDQAGDTSSAIKHRFDCRIIEEHATASGDGNAVLQIGREISSGEGNDLIADSDSLPQRRVRLSANARQKLRLSDKNETDPVAVVTLQVCDQSDFIKHLFGRDEMCFIDDDEGERVPPVRVTAGNRRYVQEDHVSSEEKSPRPTLQRSHAEIVQAS